MKRLMIYPVLIYKIIAIGSLFHRNLSVHKAHPRFESTFNHIQDVNSLLYIQTLKQSEKQTPEPPIS